MNGLPYTVITCQGINGRFVCPEQPLFCNARIPWQGLGKLQDSGFLFGVDMKEIILTRGMVALVDDEDYEWLSKFKWHATKQGYAETHINRKAKVFMHTLIMGTPSGMYVDHKDRNKSNNTKSNLRLCSRSENEINKDMSTRNTSGYKGVTKRVWWGKVRWTAEINKDKKKYHLGSFYSAEEAARAYDEAAIKLHGEFATLNFPRSAFALSAAGMGREKGE